MLKKALLMLLCLITFISAVPFSFVSADTAVDAVGFKSFCGADAALNQLHMFMLPYL